jgi:hypothetical protein
MKYENMPIVELPSPLYSLYRFEDDLSDTDIMALENACRRYESRYPGVSWFVAVSNTDSKTAFRYTERTGKRGRPKTKVDGKKIGKHVHTGAVSTNDKYGETALAFQKKISDVMNKRAGREISKPQCMAKKKLNTKGALFITYAYKQHLSFHTGGDFDFKQCKDDFYIEKI